MIVESVAIKANLAVPACARVSNSLDCSSCMHNTVSNDVMSTTHSEGCATSSEASLCMNSNAWPHRTLQSHQGELYSSHHSIQCCCMQVETSKLLDTLTLGTVLPHAGTAKFSPLLLSACNWSAGTDIVVERRCNNKQANRHCRQRHSRHEDKHHPKFLL